LLNKFTKHIKQGTLANTVYKIAIDKRERMHLRINGYTRNIYNISRYGREAPRFGELIWINPRNCNKLIHWKLFLELYGINHRAASALVVESSWPFEQERHIIEYPKIKSCFDHWIRNIPWENTEHPGLIKNNMESLKRADQIFGQVKREGRLRLAGEINEKYRLGTVSIGPRGELFFTEGGTHRFVMAYILNIPYPAQVGLVHVSAIPYLKEYRRFPPPNKVTLPR